MAPIDDLPADQQAVLRLLLTQGRSYDEIARSLKMAPAAVRDRAHEALSALGPADSRLGAGRRGDLADYLLGQQDADAAADTRAVLDDSPPARAWARVVSGELAPMARDELPEIPDGRGAATAAPIVDADGDDAARSPSGDGRARRPRSSRVGGTILLLGGGLLAAIAIGFFVGRATKSDDSPSKSSTATTSTTAAAGDVLGQANLTAPKGAPAQKAVGVAQFVKKDGQQLINVIAEGLPAAPKGSGYGVWLEGTGQAPLWLGYFQAVTKQGQVGAQQVLKVDPKSYSSVLLTQQKGRDPKTPQTTYLSGPIQLKSGS